MKYKSIGILNLGLGIISSLWQIGMLASIFPQVKNSYKQYTLIIPSSVYISEVVCIFALLISIVVTIIGLKIIFDKGKNKKLIRFGNLTLLTMLILVPVYLFLIFFVLNTG